MAETFIETFLAGFDDSQYPKAFLQKYEMMECLSNNEVGETFLIREKDSGEYFISKCYFKCWPDFHATQWEVFKNIHHDGLPAFIGDYENEKVFISVRSHVPGRSLDEAVTAFPMDRGRVVSIARQICEILIYLHRQAPPIIHRDIKPQNIIVDDRGKVTLIDFGISRVYDSTSRVDTICLGTRDFAAPEQYGFSQTDCRTDIFSLGVLLTWLLTGELELAEARKKLPQNRLGRIIRKCTAFDPEDRYQNAQQVLDALSGRMMRRRAVFVCLASVLTFLGALAFQKFPAFSTQNTEGIVFQEPQIEEAARLILQKDPAEQLTEEDLLTIDTLLIFGNEVALDDDSFDAYVNSFANNEGTVQRGSISLLDDLAHFKNLRRLSLAYQSIEDISPLSQLKYLELVDLRNSPVNDISPLSNMTSLSSLVLFDTNVTDLTSLNDCYHLRLLDIGYTPIDSLAALEGLDELEILLIRKGSLHSLEGIESFPMLEEIYLSENAIMEFSPLLALPRLQLVELSEDMRPYIEQIEDKATFTIIYQ